MIFLNSPEEILNFINKTIKNSQDGYTDKNRLIKAMMTPSLLQMADDELFQLKNKYEKIKAPILENLRKVNDEKNKEEGLLSEKIKEYFKNVRN